MLGLQKYVAQRPGIKALAFTTAMIVFTVLAFLNPAISPRGLPSISLPPSPKGDNPSSPGFHERENSSEPGRNSSAIDFNSQLSEQKKVKPELQASPSSQNSSSSIQIISVSEVTSCDEARRLPVFERRRRTSPVSIMEMEQILSNNRRLSCSRISRQSSKIDAQILRARRDIEKSPIVQKHRRLFAPAFRNISMFKRSYELMEKMLKVYIYKEGEKPIFHSPYLRGIYSSESWFMKNMEESRRFRVKDPTKAHLFYLPFSSKLLAAKLYIARSHSHKNIDQYLKNYVAGIAATYPFWNRTGGADHFLVACHDWAPFETEKAMGNSIRALCNADLSSDYKLGKDVSLPQANVFNAKNPEMGLGGYPARERPILAFFAGKMHGYLRPQLLEKWGNADPDIKVFGPMGRRAQKQNATISYAEYMRKSKFCICPRGYEVASPRIVEAILHECVPVIIADNLVPPFFEVLKWEEFSVVVKEKDIPRLKEILQSISGSKYLALQAAVKKVQKHFVWHNLPQRYDAFHMTLHSVWLNRVFQFEA